jgi:hypothetical protein
MIARGYFSHAAPEGTTVGGRVRRSGYGRWRFVAENIGWGNGSLRHPEPIFSRWMTSPGTARTSATPALREIGAGVAYGTVRGPGGARVPGRARVRGELRHPARSRPCGARRRAARASAEVNLRIAARVRARARRASPHPAR